MGDFISKFYLIFIGPGEISYFSVEVIAKVPCQEILKYFYSSKNYMSIDSR